MTATRTIVGLLVLIASWTVDTGTARASEETLARAKDLYASAAYDEALAVLDGLAGAVPSETRAIAEYRVFCLLALDRTDEARKRIEDILHDNPQYSPSSEQASPRIQSVFREVRRQSLPKIVMDRYLAAKAAYESKDPQAAQQFNAVLTLLDDPDIAGVPTLADMRTVVSAFRDLAKAAAPAQSAAVQSAPPMPAMPTSSNTAPAPEPARAAEAPKAEAAGFLPAYIVIYTKADADVVPPVGISQSVPRWVPGRGDSTQEFKGTLQLLIDEKGAVISATVEQSIHPTYNRQLLKAARDWKFVPARKQGVPVRYLKVIDIQLRAGK
jgi:TonB family protein